MNHSLLSRARKAVAHGELVSLRIWIQSPSTATQKYVISSFTCLSSKRLSHTLTERTNIRAQTVIFQLVTSCVCAPDGAASISMSKRVKRGCDQAWTVLWFRRLVAGITSTARVRSKVGLCGIYGERSDTGTGSSEHLDFPLSPLFDQCSTLILYLSTT